MSNRADRRRMMREQTNRNRSLVAGYTKSERMAGLVQNGITPEDLQKEYDDGYAAGFRDAGVNILQCCYAGICIALHDTHGFGAERCYRVLKACDEKVIYALNHAEMAEELLKKTGITLRFDDPLERVQRTADAEVR